MKKGFMKKAAAVLAASMVFSLFTAADAGTASAAAPVYVGLKTTFKTLETGEVYKLRLKNNILGWKIITAVSDDKTVCAAENKSSYVKLAAGKKEGRTVIRVTVKTSQKPAGKKSVKKLRCKVQIKPAVPAQPENNGENSTGGGYDKGLCIECFGKYCF